MKKNDYYYFLAKKKGYVSRAAFKLIQINERFYVIKRGYVVLDLGASPGGWSQVSRELVGDAGRVIAVDLNPLRIKGVEFVRGDIFSDDVVNRIRARVNEVDVIISDMAPKISGVSSWDHARSMELAERAEEMARIFLKERGHMVVKVFQGDMLRGFVRKLKKEFELVKVHKPKASKPSSSETYIICKRYIKNEENGENVEGSDEGQKEEEEQQS